MENSKEITPKELTDAPRIIVAIDGYSSSGKSTMARELAKRVGYIYIDSGAMYRAVTLYALRHGMIRENGTVDREALLPHLDELTITFQPSAGEDGVQHTLLNGEDVETEIRDMKVSTHVSPIAEIAEVREKMVALQQDFGLQKGIVMDGRDIATTVFPHAELKVFVYASPHERARRRWRELQQKGVDINFEDVLRNVEERDRIDTTRAVSPLVKAEDAIELDNGAVTHEEQMEWLMKRFQETLERIENES
ncbi:MAG: (d)CMP kinase [Muribaculaceae bacterium]|nr:(d)CMP kinase [Muribaculaceae bacterium]